MKYQGSYCALITPLKDDKFDEILVLISFVFLAGMRQADVQRDDVTLFLLQITAQIQLVSIADGNLVT